MTLPAREYSVAMLSPSAIHRCYSHPFLVDTMSFESSPSHSIPHFVAIFNTALNDYAQKTGTDLIAHPLAAVLESCRGHAHANDGTLK